MRYIVGFLLLVIAVAASPFFALGFLARVVVTGCEAGWALLPEMVDAL